jgi:hypothetical protein
MKRIVIAATALVAMSTSSFADDVYFFSFPRKGLIVQLVEQAKREEIGRLMSAGHYEAAARVAFEAGWIQEGIQLRALAQSQGQSIAPRPERTARRRTAQ